MRDDSFNIIVKSNAYEIVRIPPTESGDLEFKIFQNKSLLLALTPKVIDRNRFSWSIVLDTHKKSMEAEDILNIEREIEKHYV